MIKTNWDLSQIYSSDEEFKNDYDKVKNLSLELEKFRGKLENADKTTLLNYFKLDDEFSALLEKLAVYAHCKNDDNGKDDNNVRNYMIINDFYSQVSEKLSFTKTELANLDENFLNDVLNDSDFTDYSRVIEYLIRTKKHIISEKEESMLANISGFTNLDDIYSIISDIEMFHGEVEDENGKKIVLNTGNYNALLKNKNQNFRKKVMETYLKEYKRFNLTISNLYTSHVKYENFIAKIRGYKSTLDMKTYDEQVDSNIMMKNIEYVKNNKKLMQRYFKVKKEILGVKDFYSSDISVNLPFGDRKIPYEEAVNDIKDSFKPLGRDYQEMFEKALNDGWIDALPRENKASGGYTISTFLTHPYILLNYDSTQYWKSAIAHEFGHAMHSYLSKKTQPFAKSQYTIFVAEVASLTNEILLTKYSLGKDIDDSQRMQILADFLALFYLNVFNSTMLAEFELFVHDKLWQGESLTANDLNEKFVKICNEYYGDSVQLVENFECEWERKSHIYRDYYLYKYSTGLVVACAVASKILADKDGEYLKKYKTFLSLGDALNPMDSLKVIDIDVTSEETYKFAFNMFDEYLTQLNDIYKSTL